MPEFSKAGQIIVSGSEKTKTSLPSESMKHQQRSYKTNESKRGWILTISLSTKEMYFSINPSSITPQPDDVVLFRIPGIKLPMPHYAKNSTSQAPPTLSTTKLIPKHLRITERDVPLPTLITDGPPNTHTRASKDVSEVG